MITKHAADLKRGDAVLIAPGDRRVVEAVEFTETLIAPGTFAVRIHWFGMARANLLRPDKELTIIT